jgi:general secretion pathway protein I
MQSPHVSRGFTLVEVLVALLVLALALGALQLRIAAYVDNAAYLRDKTVANWVALNQLELLRIAQRFDASPPAGIQQGTAAMAGRTWYWALTPQQAAPDSDIVIFVIGVSADSPEAALSAPLVGITGVGHAWE